MIVSESEVMQASEWLVVTDCAHHDMHNSFQWCMPEFFGDTDLVLGCYIGVGSISNSCDVILILCRRLGCLGNEPVAHMGRG